MTTKSTKNAKTESKAKIASVEEPRKEGRYLRASRVIIEAGEGTTWPNSP